MARVAYVNGRYLPQSQASVHVEDRGNQFADGVYEVMKVIDGRIGDGDRHLARLGRSLAAVRIEPPVTDAVLRQIILETVRRNRLGAATVYVQISRGVAPRDHAFPKSATPSLIVMAKRLKRPAPEAGAYEAFLVRDGGVVTECSASNCYVVDGEGVLRTHPTSPLILGGVTRSVVLELAADEGIEVDERPFTLDDLATAKEAIVTSTSSWVMPVTQVGERVIGDGRPGPVTRRLQAAYDRHLFGNHRGLDAVAEPRSAA